METESSQVSLQREALKSEKPAADTSCLKDQEPPLPEGLRSEWSRRGGGPRARPAPGQSCPRGLVPGQRGWEVAVSWPLVRQTLVASFPQIIPRLSF